MKGLGFLYYDSGFVKTVSPRWLKRKMKFAFRREPWTVSTTITYSWSDWRELATYKED